MLRGLGTISNMKIIVIKNYQELSKKAAKIVIKAMKKKPNIVLGLATGSTPLGLYQKLIEAYKKNEIDFSKVTTFNLDEYYGLDSNHPQSYNRFMWENLFDRVNIKPENVHIPSGKSKNIKTYCRFYEAKIKKAGGIDLQILGIGRDGHIGFNELSFPLDSRTRLVKLAGTTIKDNARFFKNKREVPKFAITMGIATILEAKKIILLASGKNKTEAVAKAIEGPISNECPASALQSHANATFIVDKAVASKLKQKIYGA